MPFGRIEPTFTTAALAIGRMFQEVLPAGGSLAFFRFEILSRSPFDLSSSLFRRSLFLLLGPPPIAEFERQVPLFFEQQAGSDRTPDLPALHKVNEEFSLVVADGFDEELIQGVDRFLRDPFSRKQLHKVGSELLSLRDERCSRHAVRLQISRF
jgi:hypothetical protein